MARISTCYFHSFILHPINNTDQALLGWKTLHLTSEELGEMFEDTCFACVDGGRSDPARTPIGVNRIFSLIFYQYELIMEMSPVKRNCMINI